MIWAFPPLNGITLFQAKISQITIVNTTELKLTQLSWEFCLLCRSWIDFKSTVEKVREAQISLDKLVSVKDLTRFFDTISHFLICTFNLNHYFYRHLSVLPCVRPSVRSSVRHKIFFSLKSPWNHPLTAQVDPWGWPRVAPGHTAPPEELARARMALSSLL